MLKWPQESPPRYHLNHCVDSAFFNHRKKKTIYFSDGDHSCDIFEGLQVSGCKIGQINLVDVDPQVPFKVWACVFVCVPVCHHYSGVHAK